MIFGDETLIHIDGGEYIRIARFGDLFTIAEEMGMDKKNINILTDAVEEFQFRLKTKMYNSVKRGIPVEEEHVEFKLSPECLKSIHQTIKDEIYRNKK